MNLRLLRREQTLMTTPAPGGHIQAHWPCCRHCDWGPASCPLAPHDAPCPACTETKEN